MSEIKVNKISPRTACGTTTLGDSGDTFTIPSGVSITNQGTASGFGSTGEVSWVTTKKTTTFTVTAGEGYFCDTSSGGFTVNLPAGTAGASFAVADYTNTFQTGNLTITPNGTNKIGGVNASAVLATEGQSAYFVYVDDTEGWKNVIDSTSNLTGSQFIIATGGTVSTSGNCKIHTFTSPGTFSVSQVHPCGANNEVSYAVVAGGGGGGTGDGGGGGGGAGGYRESKSPVTPYTASPLDGRPNAPNRVTVTATSFPITVGGGGTGAGGVIPSPTAGTNGGVSTFSTITSAGGGAGGNYGGGLPATCGVGENGGSGGGGTSQCGPSSPIAGGSGNTPSTSPAQGQNGGGGKGNTGGGGGGAGAAGETSPGPGEGGAGGAGVPTGINPSNCVGTPGPAPGRFFAGGGGGNNETPGAAPVQGAGGVGGGGAGDVPGGAGNAGIANTGGGGGGIDSNPPQPSATHNGGSGIVIIRYKFQ